MAIIKLTIVIFIEKWDSLVDDNYLIETNTMQVMTGNWDSN